MSLLKVKKNVYKCYKVFQDGQEPYDEPSSERLNTSSTDDNIKAVKNIVLENHRISIREVAKDVGISVGLCRAIFLAVLDVRHMSAKLVPKLLNFDQNNHRMSIP